MDIDQLILKILDNDKTKEPVKLMEEFLLIKYQRQEMMVNSRDFLLSQAAKDEIGTNYAIKRMIEKYKLGDYFELMKK